jgi:murein DD-endopeptidase MepM/ murein hydrolase activator NlpD
VYAARDGTVVKVIDWFSKQGEEELINAANKIIIAHSDGTLASYVHLDYKGSFVKEGEFVERGEKIGISGLTGYTRGPHLHFVVRKERDIRLSKQHVNAILPPQQKIT